jgi:two-component system phosphate regulon response regulator OmpR
MDVGAHLLIVDDDERIRGLLQKFLVRNGFLVTAARDAAHARRLLAGLDFDLIVLDVMMPGEDGVSLTRDLRETIGDADPAAHRQGRDRDRIAGLEAGADDYLPSRSSRRSCCSGSTRSCGGCRNNPRRRRWYRCCTWARSATTWNGARCGMGEIVRLTATEAQLMRIFSASRTTPSAAPNWSRNWAARPGTRAGTRGRRADHPPAPQDRGRTRSSPATCRPCAARATCWPPTEAGR